MAIKELELSALRRWSGLILGEAGSGKTSLVSTIPEDQNVLIISAENGMLALREMLTTRKNVRCLTIESWDDFVEMVDARLAKPEVRQYYDWVVVDSLTAIVEACLEGYKAKNPAKAKTFEKWEFLGTEVEKYVTKLRDMNDFTVVFTCLVKYESVDESTQVLAPLMQGNMIKNRLVSWFDEALYVTAKLPATEGVPDGRRIVYTDNFEGFPAKDRSKKLDYIEKPDLGLITRKILGLGDAAPAKGPAKGKPPASEPAKAVAPSPSANAEEDALNMAKATEEALKAKAPAPPPAPAGDEAARKSSVPKVIHLSK
jgi:hypothetical protein